MFRRSLGTVTMNTNTLLFSLLSFTLLFGCVTDDPEWGADNGALTRAAEGSPEALAVLALLNDDATTMEMLDVDAGLDRRAADGLLKHRAGLDEVFAAGAGDDDLFDDLREVDSVRYVGPSAIGKLIDYAATLDFTPTGDAALGTFDGVTFTIDEGTRALTFANDETADGLLAVFARRSLDALLAARPFSTMDELAEVYWVGRATLTRLKERTAETGGEICQESDDCAEGTYCIGNPRVALVHHGRCRDVSSLPGQGDDCSADSDCADGLFCSGASVFDGAGWCRPKWMRGTFANESSADISPAPWDTGFPIFVSGLASVPEDIAVNLNLTHEEANSVVITLQDPNGVEVTLWDQEDGPLPSRFDTVPNSGDDNVNGVWTLYIRADSGVGRIDGWSLELSSRFD